MVEMSMTGSLQARHWGERMLRSIVLLLGFLLPLAAAAQEAAQDLERSQLQIASRDRAFTFQVELAQTPKQRQIGLMHRRDMAPDHGMLFDFRVTAPVSMWMRNTYIPLDMMFLRSDGVIVNIAHDTVPHSEEVLRSSGPVRAVLEVPAGTSRMLGIKPGDRVLHPVLGSNTN